MASKNITAAVKTPSVLKKLASLTAIRDIEVFELSILKTLLELLKINTVTLFKVGQKEGICQQIVYSEENHLDEEQYQHAEAKQVVSQDVTTPDYILQAQDWITSTGNPYSRKLANGQLLTVYPIQGAASIVGYIVLTLDRPLSETDTLMITSLLSISHNFHSLLEENQKDKLTGLLNRKTFEDSISKIQSILETVQLDNDEDGYQGQEKRHSFSDYYWLAVMDIDHFKYVNDTYGHVFGDEVLLLISQIMRNAFRSTDLIFRYGGEEFVVIIRAESQIDAHKLLERFRQTVENYQFPQIGQITISIGATKLDDSYIVPADLVGRADQALYYSKEHGRNQVNFYEDLVEQGELKQAEVQPGSIELF
jgi:diguanylate cyclase (GGDEF)-like protein